MAYEDDPYRDEEGEPLMDYDDIPSDDDQQHLPPNDDVQYFNDEGEEENWSNEPKRKIRKRLIVKSDGDAPAPPEFNDFADEDDVGEPEYGSFPDEEEEKEPSFSKKRKDKGVMKEGGEKRRKEKKLRKEKFSMGGRSSSGGGKVHKPKLSLKRKKTGDDGDSEINELWDTIAGAGSEVSVSKWIIEAIQAHCFQQSLKNIFYCFVKMETSLIVYILLMSRKMKIGVGNQIRYSHYR